MIFVVAASHNKEDDAFGASFNSSAFTKDKDGIKSEKVKHRHIIIFFNMETPQNIICRIVNFRRKSLSIIKHKLSLLIYFLCNNDTSFFHSYYKIQSSL